MFHEVRVNILEMNGKIQTLKMKIETIKKKNKSAMEFRNIRFIKWTPFLD